MIGRRMRQKMLALVEGLVKGIWRLRENSLLGSLPSSLGDVGAGE